MKKNNSKRQLQNTFKKRTFIIFLISLIAVIVFAGRMIWLYDSKYKVKAAEQRMKTIEIPAHRGDILDVNGNVLAESVKVNSLYYFPESVDNKSEEKLVNGLERILNLSKEEIDEILASKTSVKITDELSNEQVEELEKLELNCLTISVENKRYYPGGASLAYILGFVDEENNGVNGIEDQYNNELKGEPGLNIYTGTREGNIIVYDNSKKMEAKKGKDITLNIDEGIDAIVSNVAKKAYKKYKPNSISIIVTEPTTNKVVAMENFPRYDLNNPRVGRTTKEEEDIQSLSEEEKVDLYYNMWKNISIGSSYEPGSVFKLITSAMALEENTSNENSKYLCNGIYTDIPGVKIKCIRWYDPHGYLTMKEALAESCNIAYLQIAQEIGYAKFYEYLKAFGFGEKTGIDLEGEENGIIPKNLEEIDITELSTMSYGHGISVTPIQMITAANAIVNGGYIIEPSIVKEIEGEDISLKQPNVKRQVISESTSKRMRALMKNTIENGASTSVKSDKYSVGGKSGTTVKIKDGKYSSEKTITSFYSAFPIEDPKYSMLVVVDEPTGQNSGNAVSGAISKEINDEIAKYKNLEKKNYGSTGNKETKVPDVVGMPLSSAINKLAENDLKASIFNLSENDNMIILNQSIEAGVTVDKGTIIDLTASDSDNTLIKIPDLTGKYRNEALIELENMDIKIESKGDSEKGRVKKTIPNANEYIEPGTTLEIIYETE